jgi:hypothetical protein
MRRLRVEIERVVVEGFADAGSGEALRSGLERELASRLAAPGVDVGRGGSWAEIQRVADLAGEGAHGSSLAADRRTEQSPAENQLTRQAPAANRLTERAAEAVVCALRSA